MKNYLVYLTFYAGSNDPEDTDRDIFLLETEETTSKKDLEKIIKEANRLCNIDYDDPELPEDFPSYEDAVNIYTLVEAIKALKNVRMTSVFDFKGVVKGKIIEDCYEIEQWQ